MYESYFGFKDTPFRLSADEKFRYAHKNYLRASAYLAYALEQGEGFVMITGHPGSGKTTLIRDVISELDETRYNVLSIVTSQLHAEELLRKVALEYGYPAESDNKATLLTNIQKHLSTLHEQGKQSVLFLDEAQNLSLNGLEELRLLSNLQQGKHSLLQIVLVGHDELRQLVLGPDMKHVQQRLIASCKIESLSQEQTQEYIIHRLQHVDWQTDPKIEEGVYQLIHLASQGVPRNINHLMSQLLLFACIEEKHHLTDEDALIIIEELIDQQRITLADEERFESFAERYRAERQHQVMPQAVGNPSGFTLASPAHDSWRLEEQDPDPMRASQQKVSKLHNPASDDLAAANETTLESPDPDLLLWSGDAEGEYDTETLPEEEANPAYTGNTGKPPIDDLTDGPINQVHGPEPMLPNADEIWNGAMKSEDMESLFPLNRRQKSNYSVEPPENQSTTQAAEGQIHEESEERWGGVWFMSNADNPSQPGNSQQQRTSIIKDTILPPASSLKQNHNITVDENLRMPSVWVEDCPEIVATEPDEHHYQQHKPNKFKVLKRSIIHVLVLVSIGLMVLLAIKLFPDEFNSLFPDLDTQNSSLIDTTQDVLTPVPLKETEDSAPIKSPPIDTREIERSETPSIVLEQRSADIQNAHEDATPETQLAQKLNAAQPQIKAEVKSPVETAPPSVDDSDISSYHNIKLATRYFVYFDFNKYTIPFESEALLKSIRDKMLLEENNFLKITGYADSQGNGNYNHRLSLKRANAVKEYFTIRGIPEERLRVSAVGSVSNGQTKFESINARRQIRRVEVILFPK
jgi:type II secretory pathway predicted ATPase ExeA/outer membrane protein OmpA-like peptidoglycan-associated protein